MTLIFRFLLRSECEIEFPNNNLVRALAFVIAWRVIVADDKHPAIVALSPSAAEPDRVPPHDLRVVQALVADA